MWRAAYSRGIRASVSVRNADTDASLRRRRGPLIGWPGWIRTPLTAERRSLSSRFSSLNPQAARLTNGPYMVDRYAAQTLAEEAGKFRKFRAL